LLFAATRLIEALCIHCIQSLSGSWSIIWNLS